MIVKTYGRKILVLTKTDDVELRFLVNNYSETSSTYTFTDFMDNDKLHIYPWHQIKHITLKQTEYEDEVEL